MCATSSSRSTPNPAAHNIQRNGARSLYPARAFYRKLTSFTTIYRPLMTFTSPPAKFGGTNKRGARRTDFKGVRGDEAPAIVTTDLRRMPAVVRRFFRLPRGGGDRSQHLRREQPRAASRHAAALPAAPRQTTLHPRRLRSQRLLHARRQIPPRRNTKVRSLKSGVWSRNKEEAWEVKSQAS